MTGKKCNRWGGFTLAWAAGRASAAYTALYAQGRHWLCTVTILQLAASANIDACMHVCDSVADGVDPPELHKRKALLRVHEARYDRAARLHRRTHDSHRVVDERRQLHLADTHLPFSLMRKVICACQTYSVGWLVGWLVG